MKRKSLMFRGFILLVASVLILGANSCSKDEVAIEKVNDDDFGKYTKELTVYDATGENSAVVLVGSDDESILNMWTSENISLIPVYKNQTSQEAIDDYLESNPKEKNNSISDDDSDEIGASVSFMIIAENLKDGVSKVILYTNDPYDDDLRGWKYEYHYSVKHSPTSNITCVITGKNWWMRGYWALSYKPLSENQSWVVWYAEWVQIKSGDVVTKERKCYQMRARRKYKGDNNNSVIIAFED